MLGGLEGQRFSKRNDFAAVDFGKREAGVSPTDVGDRDPPHDLS
jgi:hypothetical protein